MAAPAPAAAASSAAAPPPPRGTTNPPPSSARGSAASAAGARGGVLRIIEPRDVSACEHSEEGRQGAPLLQRGGEQARERWTRAATARAVSGGDQLVAGACVAPLDRGIGRGHASSANARAVSRGSLRRGGRGRIDRAPEALAAAAGAAAAVGCVLACAEAVAEPGARWVLGRATGALAQRHALGSSVAGARGLSAVVAGQRVAIASALV